MKGLQRTNTLIFKNGANPQKRFCPVLFVVSFALDLTALILNNGTILCDFVKKALDIRWEKYYIITWGDIMEWNEVVISKIHSIVSINVKGGDGGKVNRRFSGLVFAKNGSVSYRMNGEEYVLDSGHVVYLPCADYVYEPTNDGVCYQINFDCNFDSGKFLAFPISDPEIYEEKIEDLRKIFYEENGMHSHHASLAALYDILAALDKEFEASQQGEYSRTAIRIMRSEFADVELSNDVIAERLNISTVYFRKLFLRETGISPMAYLRKLRMDKAKEYLKLPGVSVSDTAYAVGYSGIYPFSRVFKREIGISPAKYAAKYKNSY